MKLTIKQLSEVSFDEVLALFEETCGCNGCWCMNHHFPDGTAPEGDGARQELESKFQKGEISAMIAFVAGKPVGWCAIDEKEKLLGHDCLRAGSTEPLTWAIHCVFVNDGHRGKGISTKLIEAAISYAKSKNARVIEAYPFKVPEGKTVKNAQHLFSGPFRVYERLGFVEAEQFDDFYTVMSLSL